MIKVCNDFFWHCGDIVEICGNYSSSMTMVMDDDDIRQTKIMVKLIGCRVEFLVEVTHVRMRQSWIDEEWIAVGKVSFNDIPRSFCTLYSFFVDHQSFLFMKDDIKP